MSRIYQAVYTASNESLEFIRVLANGPLKEAFDELKGQPIKDYPPQKQPDGSDAVTISQKLVGRQHPEFDRTALGLVQLYGVLRNDIETFPGLSESNFRIVQQYVYDAIKFNNIEAIVCSVSKEIPRDHVDPDKLEALGVLLGIHDLAKIVNFDGKAKAAAGKHGFNLDVKEHDEIAWAILTSQNQPLIEELYPSYAVLNEEQRNLVLGALAGGINPGRIYQLEGTPGEFALATRHGAINFDPAMYAAFHILDMGSIRGNSYVVEGAPLLNAQGKRADAFWNNATIGFMPPILKLAGQVALGSITPVEAYNEVVKMRAQQFGLDLLTTDSLATVRYAATRLCAMMSTRFANFTATEVPQVVFYLQNTTRAEDAWKLNLIQELATSGYDGKPSICVGYAPDIAAKIYQGMKENTSNTFINMFEVFAKSLDNFFIVSRAAINRNEVLRSQPGQITVEAEKLHPLLIGKDYDALSKAPPVLTWSGGGFVASLGLGFSYVRSGSPTFGKPNKGDIVEPCEYKKLEGASMK